MPIDLMTCTLRLHRPIPPAFFPVRLRLSTAPCDVLGNAFPCLPEKEKRLVFSRQLLPFLSTNMHTLWFSCIAGHMVRSIKRKQNYRHCISCKYQHPMMGHSDVNFQRYIRCVRPCYRLHLQHTVLVRTGGFGVQEERFCWFHISVPLPISILQFLSGMFYMH